MSSLCSTVMGTVTSTCLHLICLHTHCKLSLSFLGNNSSMPVHQRCFQLILPVANHHVKLHTQAHHGRQHRSDKPSLDIGR